MRTIGKLFTYWKIADYKVWLEPLYQDYKSAENDAKPQCVKHAVVSQNGRAFADTAHIIFRADHDGNPKALIHADIFYGDETMFIKNANLQQLEDYMN